eukprot:jgi/Mesen1/11067/ME000099S10511
MAVEKSAKDVAVELLDFINKAWTPFHAVYEAKARLKEAGYSQLSEKEPWSLQPGGKYFFTRNFSTIVAFAVGKKFKAGSGFWIIGAHTDSPGLKLKPVSKVSKGGFLTVGVQTYGGGLWHTWFDRDLGVAGRVLVRTSAANAGAGGPGTDGDQGAGAGAGAGGGGGGGGGGGFRHQLVKIDKPILRVATLAIHLDREVNSGFKVNTQTHLAPLLATSIKALMESSAGDGLEEESGVRMVALFDHEEVGSNSAQGAGSPVMFDALRRVTAVFAASSGQEQEGVVERALQRSFLVSADMAHCLHPNYQDKHEESHQPKMHGGLVIKTNANQRYATNAVTAFLFREIAARHNIPTQEFVVRNDVPCGSTIGPILASGVGIRTVDVGAPQLSMHSVREMCGVDDVAHACRHLTAFFRDFAQLDAQLDVDGPSDA